LSTKPSFGDNLDTALNGMGQHPIALIISEGLACDSSLDAVDGSKHVVKRVTEFARHLEDAHCRFFDVGPQPWVQAIACRDIHGNTQLVFEKQFDPD
jgi:hypothetical protein